VCKKICIGHVSAPAADENATVAAVLPVNIPALMEFKLYGMHLWVTEKLSQGVDITVMDFTANVGIYI
jgi:hypothetical protein